MSADALILFTHILFPAKTDKKKVALFRLFIVSLQPWNYKNNCAKSSAHSIR